MFDLLVRERWIALTSAALLLCVFLLPFAFPASHPAYSQSYVVGFNNRVAILSVGLFSLAVLAFLTRARSAVTSRPSAPSRLRWPLLLTASCIVLLWVGAFCLLSLSESARVGESPYFLIQMEKVLLSHRTLYTQVEFAYGPILLYPTLWLSRLFAGPLALDRAYYITLLLHHLAGLGMLWFIVNRLPLTRTVRLVSFLSLGLYCLNPWMGLNYTLFRFLAPAFCVVLLSELRRPLLLAVVTFCLPFVTLALSAECAVTVTVGAVGFCCARAVLLSSRAPLIGSATALAGFAAALLTAPRGSLEAMLHFSNGFHQTPLLPSPGVLLILACAVWLAPATVAQAFTVRDASFPLLVGLYAVSLANLPVTLATTDSMHLLSNGIVLVLLGACYASGEPRAARLWMVACPAVFGLFLLQCILAVWYGFTANIPCADSDHHLATLATRISPRLGRSAAHAEARGCPLPIQPTQLPAPAAQQGFSILNGSSLRLTPELIRLPGNNPVFFANQINVWSPEAQQLIIQQIRRQLWLIAPAYPADHPVSPELDNPLDFHPHLRARHVIAPDDLIAAEIKSSWTPVEQLAPTLWLYQRSR